MIKNNETLSEHKEMIVGSVLTEIASSDEVDLETLNLYFNYCFDMGAIISQLQELNPELNGEDLTKRAVYEYDEHHKIYPELPDV